MGLYAGAVRPSVLGDRVMVPYVPLRAERSESVPATDLSFAHL